MPVPGPRVQERPVPGYANPWHQHPDRINPWEWPEPVTEPGRSPGTMALSLRGNVLAAGQIRRLWRQAVNLIGAQAPYSWTRSAPAPGRPVVAPPGLGVTAALRYMARSVYAGGGEDNSRFAGLHTKFQPRVHSKTVTIPAGAVRSRPTIRNRLTSFGSRVDPLNQRAPGAQQ